MNTFKGFVVYVVKINSKQIKFYDRNIKRWLFFVFKTDNKIYAAFLSE